MVKILGDGEYTKHLTFTDIDAFSASAKIKIEKPGTASKTAGKPYAKIDKTKKVEKLRGGKVEKLIKKPTIKKEAPKTEIKKVDAPVKKIEVVAEAKPVAKKPVKKVEAKPVVKAPVKKVEAKPAAKKSVAKASAKKPAPKKAK